MADEKVIHLTEDQYAAFTILAKQTGQTIEALVHEILDEYITKRIQLSSQISRSRPIQEISEQLFEEGFFESIPIGETLSKDEEEELEHLGNLFEQGKLLSEMIIEDRGPY